MISVYYETDFGKTNILVDILEIKFHLRTRTFEITSNHTVA